MLNFNYYTKVITPFFYDCRFIANKKKCNFFFQHCTPDKLNQLNLADLIKKSMISRSCLIASRNVFREKHKGIPINFRGPFIAYDEDIEEQNRSISIRNVDLIENFLKNFNDFVTVIHVSFEEIDVTQGKFIINWIDELCYNVLVELSFNNCPGICQLKNDFIHVKTFKFSSGQAIDSIDTTTSDNFKWNKVFLFMERLILESVAAADWKHFEGKHRKLRELNFQFSKTNEQNVKNITHIFHIIKANREIELIDCSYCSLDILKKAYLFLPHLQYLQLKSLSDDYLNVENKPIFFNNMWFFEIISENADKIPTNLVFNHLYSLFLIFQHEFTDKWFEFMSEQVTCGLSSLFISAKFLTKHQLMDIAQKKPNLKTVEFSFEMEFVADDILKFISSLKYLSQLRLTIQMDDDEQKILQDSLPERWTLDKLKTENMETDRVKLFLDR